MTHIIVESILLLSSHKSNKNLMSGKEITLLPFILLPLGEGKKV